jgi:lactoylglutathione lyase
MHRNFTTILLCYVFSLTVGCNIDHSQYKRDEGQSSNPSFPEIIPGTDGPADSETLGYTFNHHALLVSSLTNTRKFYGDVLGMRHIFTFRLNPHWSLMFMGHAQGGKNGTGFQDAETLELELRNREGLLEFISYEVCGPPPAFKEV